MLLLPLNWPHTQAAGVLPLSKELLTRAQQRRSLKAQPPKVELKVETKPLDVPPLTAPVQVVVPPPKEERFSLDLENLTEAQVEAIAKIVDGE